MPKLVILAGPNGAGKSTCAAQVLRGSYQVETFVNADVIARGLSAFSPETSAFEAAAIMLQRSWDLAAAQRDFAFETTLASRTLAPWIRELFKNDYEFHLAFVSLPSADLAVKRVEKRVASGGHSVPETTIRRRYAAGLRNLFQLYLPLATSWQVYDNSKKPRLVAAGVGAAVQTMHDNTIWNLLEAASRS